MSTVELSAGKVDYREDGHGPTVVLLHGVMMTPSIWDDVLPELPTGFRYVRPLLPLGAHRQPMHANADLSLAGQVRLVAEFLEALDVRDVTLVHTDWGGALLLTARGLDQRVGRLVILPCEAFDNFPPGLPGAVASAAARIPCGLIPGAWLLRLSWLRRAPFLMGQMAKRPIRGDLIREWTTPILTDRQIRRDFRRYATSPFDTQELTAQTEALAGFAGDALVLWSPENRVMPPAHGRRLAELLARGRLVEIDDAYVLSMLDQPHAVAAHISVFLTATHPEA